MVHQNEMRREPIRVLIADSTRMGSELLADILQRNSHFRVVGCAADWNEVVSFLPSRPEIAVIAADFEKTSGGLETTHRLAERYPEIKSVMLLDKASDRDLVVQSFRVGARGIFSRAESVRDVTKCICSVRKGEIWATPEQIGYLLEALKNSAPSRFVSSDGITLLTDREQEVVCYVAEGLGNREIAGKMKLSEHTVKNHLFRIYSKLGIRSRVEIMFAAMSQGLSTRSEAGSTASKSDAELFQWYLRQADYGPYAQYMVGKMYIEGRGMEQDFTTGYAWLLLSEESAKEVVATSKELRENVAAQIDKEHLKQATREALKRWQDSHSPDEHPPHMLVPESPTAEVEELVGGVVDKAG